MTSHWLNTSFQNDLCYSSKYVLMENTQEIPSISETAYKMLSPSHDDVIKTVSPIKNGSQTVFIQSIDYSGNAGMAKIKWKIIFPDRKGIEINYLLLLKGEDGWKIVSKNAYVKKFKI